MNCKVCNTRIGPSERSCPNCGSDAPSRPAYERQNEPGPLPSADLSTAREEIDDDLGVELEVEVDDVTGEIDEGKPAPAPKPPKPARPAPANRRASPAPAKAAPREPAPAAAPAAANPFVAPDARALRAMLAEQPGMIEPGLRVYQGDDGKPLGVGYASDVGDIDLLATDGSGDLVVVMISAAAQGETLVAEVLQRVGWVRKHVGEGKKRVRGIVLCQEPPAGLSYAAAAVADTVAFKTFRVALTFQDVAF
jgi:hypothetical protein